MRKVETEVLGGFESLKDNTWGFTTTYPSIHGDRICFLI
jgi:hypothetical protein